MRGSEGEPLELFGEVEGEAFVGVGGEADGGVGFTGAVVGWKVER